MKTTARHMKTAAGLILLAGAIPLLAIIAAGMLLSALLEDRHTA